MKADFTFTLVGFICNISWLYKINPINQMKNIGEHELLSVNNAKISPEYPFTLVRMIETAFL